MEILGIMLTMFGLVLILVSFVIAVSEVRSESDNKEKCTHKTCYKCGHLFENGGKEVPIFYSQGWADRKVRTYCENCIPCFDKVWVNGFRCYVYLKEIAVTEDGKPIKGTKK